VHEGIQCLHYEQFQIENAALFVIRLPFFAAALKTCTNFAAPCLTARSYVHRPFSVSCLDRPPDAACCSANSLKNSLTPCACGTQHAYEQPRTCWQLSWLRQLVNVGLQMRIHFEHHSLSWRSDSPSPRSDVGMPQISLELHGQAHTCRGSSGTGSSAASTVLLACDVS